MLIALCALYVQHNLKLLQGIKNLSADKAVELAGTDPDYAVRDLYTAIGNKDFPSWTAYIQVCASSCNVHLNYNTTIILLYDIRGVHGSTVQVTSLNVV
jgi:catalase